MEEFRIDVHKLETKGIHIELTNTGIDKLEFSVYVPSIFIRQIMFSEQKKILPEKKGWINIIPSKERNNEWQIYLKVNISTRPAELVKVLIKDHTARISTIRENVICNF